LAAAGTRRLRRAAFESLLSLEAAEAAAADDDGPVDDAAEAAAAFPLDDDRVRGSGNANANDATLEDSGGAMVELLVFVAVVHSILSRLYEGSQAGAIQYPATLRSEADILERAVQVVF
jgi:hypothetical protein